MLKQRKTLAKRAEQLWDRRELSALANMPSSPGAQKSPEVLYYAGLALSALNKNREALLCWRKARELDPEYDAPVRSLAYELADRAPASAAELFYHLIALKQANADDLTALGEIRLKQGLLGEARRLLQQALEREPGNSLALLAMASLYAQVRDRALALQYLGEVAKTEDIDLSELASDPEFEFLWADREFEKIVSENGRKIA